MLTEDAFELAGLAPDGRPYVFAGAGHFLNLDQPDEFDAMIAESLDAVSDDRRSRSSPARLGEVLVLDVRTPQEYDGTRRPAVRPAAGPHPRRAQPRRLPAARVTPDELATELGGRRRRGDRRVLPQRLALGDSRRRRCARSATTRATTSARGTSGRATTTCRSSSKLAAAARNARQSRRPSSCQPAARRRAPAPSSARGRGSVSSVHHASAWSRRTSGMELHAPGDGRRRGTPAATGPRGEQRRRRPGTSKRVGVRVERAEARRQDAEHRVALARRRSARCRRSRRASGATRRDRRAERVRERLRAEADAEQRRLAARPSAAARRTRRAATGTRASSPTFWSPPNTSTASKPSRRRSLRADVPLDAARGRPRRATSPKSSGRTSGPWMTASTRIRRSAPTPRRAACAASAAPAGACATPSVWLLLLKNA